MSAAGGSQRYLNSTQLLENAIDYSLEDPALLGIRGRSNFARTLFPMEDKAKAIWEYANYGVGLSLLFVLWFLFRVCRKKRERRQQSAYLGVNV